MKKTELNSSKTPPRIKPNVQILIFEVCTPIQDGVVWNWSIALKIIGSDVGLTPLTYFEWLQWYSASLQSMVVHLVQNSREEIFDQRKKIHITFNSKKQCQRRKTSTQAGNEKKIGNERKKMKEKSKQENNGSEKIYYDEKFHLLTLHSFIFLLLTFSLLIKNSISSSLSTHTDSSFHLSSDSPYPYTGSSILRELHTNSNWQVRSVPSCPILIYVFSSLYL